MITEIDRFNQTLTRCCSIIKNNDKLSSDGVFDELSKILFMKNQYDRKCRVSGKSFSPEEFNQFLNSTSEEIKREMKDVRLGKEIKKIQVKQASLKQIIEEITGYGMQMGANAVESLRQVQRNIGKPILNLFDLGRMTNFAEVLFMERCLRLLKPGGRMGIVLPEGFLNSDKFEKARDYVEGKAKLILIASLPRETFRLSGVKVKASIVFLKKM